MSNQIQDSAKLGKFLQRVYSDGITNQISEDFRDWEMVKKFKVSDQAARTVDFLINKSYGAAAVKWKNSGAQTLPAGSQSNTEEGSAGFNQMYSTVELEADLWERAKSGAKKYLEPLAHEIQNKGIVQKRILSAAFHLDGTGIMAEVESSVAEETTKRRLTLKKGDAIRGGERYLEYGDEIVVYAADGTAGTTALVLVVEDKDRKSNSILVSDKAGSSLAAVNITDGDMVYREDSAPVDVSAPITTEYNDLSTQMVGLETLTAKDGRKIHGLTLSGVYKGQHTDVENASVDISHLQAALDDAKTRNGPSFKYSQILSAPETQSAFIESQEADRRLVSNSDKERGFAGFCFVHGNDKLEMATSEFVGDSRMWSIPDGKAAGGCLELHGKDFTELKADGQSTFLKASSAGYQNVIQKFMIGYMTMICKRPGAIVKLHNFKN